MENPSSHAKIYVAIVQFYPFGRVPKSINVKDITLPLVKTIPGYITGLSGYPHRSLMYARQYAEQHAKEMVVVNFDVRYRQPLLSHQRLMTLELLKEHDVLDLLRASKDLVAHIAAYWKQWIIEDEGEAAEAHYNWKESASFVALRPDFIPRLLQQSEFEHINLLSYPVYTSFHDQPLKATSFKIDYPLIENAHARFHPEIEVTLD